MTPLDIMMKRSGGIAAGIPTLRFLLALGILLSGIFEVNIRFAAIQRSPLGIISLAAPTMVLTLTGFLLARSADKRSGRDLLMRYGLRLLPPLVVSLILTIVVLGLVFSTIGLRDYFTAGETWSYLGNAVGWLNARLPGVFEFNNASAIVNASLWIVPVMLFGCVLAALAAPIPHNARRGLFVVMLVGAVGLALALDLGWVDPYAVLRDIRPLLAAKILAGLSGLLLGMIAYGMRRRVPVGALFIATATMIVMAAAAFPRFWMDSALAQAALSLPLAYLALSLAVASLPVPWPLQKVNYSVGIVLYGYPVGQAWIAWGGIGQSLVVSLLLSLPVTLLLAAGSWHLVERPLIVRRRDDPVLSVSGGGSLPRLHPFGWYARRLRQALPTAMMILAFVAIMLALMAVVMFALQRDQPGM